MGRVISSSGSFLDDLNYFEKDRCSEAAGFHDGRVSASKNACKDALFSSKIGVHCSSSGERWWYMHMKDWSFRNLAAAAIACVAFGSLVAIMVSFGG